MIWSYIKSFMAVFGELLFKVVAVLGIVVMIFRQGQKDATTTIALDSERKAHEDTKEALHVTQEVNTLNADSVTARLSKYYRD